MQRYIILCVILALIPFLAGADVKTKRKSSFKPHGDCPARVTSSVARLLITDWMQAEMQGHTKPTLAKNSCLAQKSKYRLVLPGTPTDHVDRTIDLFATKWKIVSLKKIQDTKFSTDYLADIQISGTSSRTPSSKKSKQKTTSFTQKVLFAFPRGMEAKVFGCVMFHSQWEKDFIQQSCLK